MHTKIRDQEINRVVKEVYNLDVGKTSKAINHANENSYGVQEYSKCKSLAVNC